MKTIALMASLLAAAVLPGSARANVTPAEADTLKTTLTPFGAVRAGNATGEIPAWTGGMTVQPEYLHASKAPDFHAGDKPVLRIDADNVDKYAARLSPGEIALLKNFKGFHFNIYPTHRDGRAPQWVYDNIRQNATRAIMVDHRPENGYGGTPFPIPHTGEEVAWNIDWEWEGRSEDEGSSNYIVPFGHDPILSSRIVTTHRFDGYVPGQSLSDWNGYIWKADINYVAPAARAGEQLIAWTDGAGKAEREVWQYLVGQHRLRKAPNIAYDGTFPDCAGFAGTDELEVWTGHTDRYVFKIVGKREMYVPYDNNDYSQHTHAEVLQPHYMNPDLLRMELHRVWVIDMTVAPGARHIIPHRVIYVDEDVWTPLLGDEYNAQGNLWRVNFGLTGTNPGIPAIFAQASWIMDLNGGGYCAENFNFIPDGDIWRHEIEIPPESAYEPDTIAAEASR